MKKLVAGLLACLLCLSLFGCGGSASTVSNEQSSTGEVTDTAEEQAKKIVAGDKITTENKEIKINNVELTYDVLPDDTSNFYTHYPADTGKVYICVDADVTNTAKQKLACDEIGTIVADYNDGYTYNGFVIVDDSSTGFTYASITNIDPLETRGIKWLIECPEEVEESTNPLFFELLIDGEKYVYTIR